MVDNSKKKVKSFEKNRQIKRIKKYFKDPENYAQFDNQTVGIIIPDKDIIPGAENLKPAYIVFNNYELILKWNRSLRFALAVCNLKEKIKNEL